MSNYTKATNFLAKDSLAPGDPLKIVRGSEIDAEFEAIASAIATKVDSSDTPFSFRNKIINGNFDIWQRGTSQTAFGVLSADRWIHAPIGAATFSSSRQGLSPGAVDGASYVVSIDVSNSVAAGDGFILAQKIEDVRTLAGKTVTVSVVAANASGEDFAVELEQNFGSGGSPAVTTFVGKSTALSSTFTRHSFTATLPSISGKTIGAGSFLTLNIWLSAGSNFDARTGSLGHNNGVFNITQVQVEEEAVATPFEYRPIGLELSLCERYFELVPKLQFSTYGQAANLLGMSVQWRTIKRSTPALSGSPSYSNMSGLTTESVSASGAYIYASVTAAGPAVWVWDNVSVDAEL